MGRKLALLVGINYPAPRPSSRAATTTLTACTVASSTEFGFDEEDITAPPRPRLLRPQPTSANIRHAPLWRFVGDARQGFLFFHYSPRHAAPRPADRAGRRHRVRRVHRAQRHESHPDQDFERSGAEGPRWFTFITIVFLTPCHSGGPLLDKAKGNRAGQQHQGQNQTQSK
ncbi:hypothetical protein ZWY2020_059509 [Hordeum vulgare]|nr:hypothetical protein ZWY2020_059509 [Hordeum vulgare]